MSHYWNFVFLAHWRSEERDRLRMVKSTGFIGLEMAGFFFGKKSKVA